MTTVNTQAARKLRVAEEAARDYYNAPLAGDDIYRLIREVVAAESPRVDNREDRYDLRQELAVLAARWLAADFRECCTCGNPAELVADERDLCKDCAISTQAQGCDPIRPARRRWRREDRDRLAEKLRAAIAPMAEKLRRDRGEALPTDLDSLIRYAEAREARAAQGRAKRDGRAWLADGDPAPDWLREVVAGKSAAIAAAILHGVMPEVTSNEWAAAEGCSREAWDTRVSRAIKMLLKDPVKREWLAAELRQAEPRGRRDPIAAANDALAANGIQKPEVAKLPDQERLDPRTDDQGRAIAPRVKRNPEHAAARLNGRARAAAT